MNIVFIVGSYFPYYSAVGKCIGNVADELAKEHKVTVICLKDFAGQKHIEINNNQKIIRVDTKENKIRNRLIERIQTEKGLMKKTYRLILNIYKMSRIIKMILSPTTIRKELVNVYLKTLDEIGKSIDLVVPTSLPFESVISALRYVQNKDNKTKIIPYLFDQFTKNRTLHRISFNMKLKRRNHLSLEEDMLKNAYSILVTPQLNEYFKLEFPCFMGKIHVVEHPLLKKYTDKTSRILEGIDIIYTGSFYKKIRNPEYMLEVVDKALVHIKARINIYSFGDCEKIIKKYSNRNCSIICHGKVTTEEAYEAISKSHILIAVGNKDNSQSPSKIFEYLSFGKPIIYFYLNDDDVNLNILKKYPLSLCLKQELYKLEENVIVFNEFCKMYSNSNISFDEVKKIYYYATPSYITDLIRQLIMNNNIND